MILKILDIPPFIIDRLRWKVCLDIATLCKKCFLQDHQGYLDLFPAIPDAWKKQKVSFKNFRSYGGVLVNAELEKGVMKKISLSIPRKMNIKIKNPFDTDKICVERGAIKEIVAVQDGFISLDAYRGRIKLQGCGEEI